MTDLEKFEEFVKCLPQNQVMRYGNRVTFSGIHWVIRLGQYTIMFFFNDYGHYLRMKVILN